jgi:hypothetical protein
MCYVINIFIYIYSVFVCACVSNAGPRPPTEIGRPRRTATIWRRLIQRERERERERERDSSSMYNNDVVKRFMK